MKMEMSVSKQWSIHSGCTDAALILSLLSHAAHFVLPDTCTPARMQFCRAEVFGSILPFSENQNLVLLRPQSHFVSNVNVNTGLKDFVSVLLYLLYLLQTIICLLEANCLYILL